MRLVCGLGNPGPEYARTRHNVGWWLLEDARERWRFGPFERAGNAVRSAGSVAGVDVVLLAPLTWMNRSGDALGPWLDRADVAGADLLVVVDDVALAAGRARIRATGSAGGHNGLKSIETAFGSRDYARLRIGVGAPPPGVDLVEWVLSPMPLQDETEVVGRLPDLVTVLALWATDGVEVAARACNGADGPAAAGS
jgi:PTH1 family peptidyl-tRNA hydrolase